MYAFDVANFYADWEQGHSPVTTGQAPWLPSKFVQGMHFVRNEIGREKIKRLKESQDSPPIGQAVVSG